MRFLRAISCLLFALVILVLPAPSSAQVFISVGFAPPPLPVYEQPYCPAEGYMWVPGYWAYDEDYGDYFWVPGTWVLAPEPGLLWTPGYWAWERDRFFFHEGYWGPQVGFYGGIPYGYGYDGDGYQGGRWDHGRFFYNRSVNNVNVTEIHNVYNTTIINNNTTVNRVSYNGGQGGINRRPTPEEEAAGRMRHVPPVADQVQHVQIARNNPELRASVNQGKPPIAATPRPGTFNDRGVVPAKRAGAPYTPPVNRAASQPQRGYTPANPFGSGGPVHPRDLPPLERPSPPNTGNPKLNQKYQQQQDQLFQKQQQERQQLEQQQEMQHQRIEQQQAAAQARQQQLEQQHQQQTQQMMQRQMQQQQRLQQREQKVPPPKAPPRSSGSENRPH